jgi:hypothetical protein
MHPLCIAVTAALIGLAGATASAQEPHRKLGDLVNQNAQAGQAALQSRGWSLAHSDVLRGKTWQYWWHGKDDACAMVTVAHARFERIAATAESDCVPKGGNAWRMSSKGKVTAGAAKALGVDALMHRSHERDEQRYNDVRAVAEFERGYRDGLQAVVLTRAPAKDAYGDGHQAGSVRRAMQAAATAPAAPATAAGPGGGLIGLRTAALAAAMKARGYERWSSFSKGRDSFAVWRQGPGQCLRTVARDDVVVEIGEVGETECR